MSLKVSGFLLMLLVCSSIATCAAPPLTAPGVMGTPASEPGAGERWIEVDLERQVVRLYDGDRMLGEHPVATGRGDSPATFTYTGTFTVYNKIKEPTYLPEFDVYISDWVGFDRKHAIGFHSLPQDSRGRVVDGRLGAPISHGCVRVGNAAAVYNFAEIGMRVVVR